MRSLPVSARLPLLLLGMLALVSGVLAGLARLALPAPSWAAAQAGQHGSLMVAAFLGTVISLERAVALARPWPYLAPLCAGLGGLGLVSGALPLLAVQGLLAGAALVLVLGSVLLTWQQPAPHTATLAVGAACWLLGQAVWLRSGVPAPATPWWIAFLAFTIAGERLELTRLRPTPVSARMLFGVLLAVAVVGLGLSVWQPAPGNRLFALALLGLALWLLRHDLARHTVRQAGLTRFIAVCLLAGYGWLAAGGLLGLAGAFLPGHPWRDAALHAVFLGFVFSMIFGHAPIILPAVARVPVAYGPLFYLPLAALHASVLARVAGTLGGVAALGRTAALANAGALLLFVLVLLRSVLRGRLSPTAPRP